MANPQHLKWLREGVEAWNKRRLEAPFKAGLREADLHEADLREADLREADLRRANLSGAILSEADLSGADLSGAVLHGAVLIEANLTEADLSGVLLRGAVLHGANLREADAASIVNSVMSIGDGNATVFATFFTDFKITKSLTQTQINQMRGDSGTLLPDHLEMPKHWKVIELPRDHPNYQGEVDAPSPFHTDETARGPSPVRFTPPTAFKTEGQVLDIDHTPKRPDARQASNTPIDIAQGEKLRAALREQFRTLCKLLRKYKREDIKISNRVRIAEQMLITCEALATALGKNRDDFQPTLLEDYTETLAIGFQGDKHAFESNDHVAFDRAIARARQLYNFYPELIEASDPSNTRHIPDNFPYTVASLSAELDDIVYSNEGVEFFSDATRELIEAEKNALVRPELNEEKTKLARLSAISGELWQEMKIYRDRMASAAGRAKGGVDKGAAWLKTFEKVEKIWDAVKEFIGNAPDV